MNIFLLTLIGISLSMDTFSLSMSLGSFNVSKKSIFLFSFIVGIFHFLMPILGFLLGNLVKETFVINPNKLLFIIFLFLSLQMLIDLKKEDKSFDLNIFNMFLYAFSVSIDSFTIGVGLEYLGLAPLIFSVLSFFFTFIGLYIGKFSFNVLGKLSKIIGLLIVFLLAVLHLFR